MKMALLVYILLGILIIVLEVRRRRGGQSLDAMTAFNCYYFVLFVFVPINVLWLGADVVRQQYAYETFGSGNAWTALSLLLCYVLFCLGYRVKSAKGSQLVAPGRDNSFSLRDSARVAKIIFLFGVFLMAVYVVQIGGISDAISKASEVRSGEFVIESKYIGYRHLMPFSATAFVLFVAVVLGKRIRKIKITTGDKVFLFCASLLFVYYALSTGGRRPLIYPILLCYLVYASLGGRLKKTAVVVLALVFIIAGLGSFLGPIILSGNVSAGFDVINLNAADWRGLAEVTYDVATQGLADSYVHFVAAQKASLWQFGFLTDIVSLPRDFFPSQIFGFERSPELGDEVNKFMLGYRIPEGFSGGETLGLHGYLLVNFGYAGMFALFFVLGLVYKWLHLRLKPANPKDAVSWLIYWWFVLAFFVYFRDGMLIFVLKEQLTWWLTIALLLHYRAKHARTPSIQIVSEGIHGISSGQGHEV
jgi:hypothetical protein